MYTHATSSTISSGEFLTRAMCNVSEGRQLCALGVQEAQGNPWDLVGPVVGGPGLLLEMTQNSINFYHENSDGTQYDWNPGYAASFSTLDWFEVQLIYDLDGDTARARYRDADDTEVGYIGDWVDMGAFTGEPITFSVSYVSAGISKHLGEGQYAKMDNIGFGEVGAASLVGDYNGDGTVGAADYTVWRDGDSPDSTTAAYALWVANFGQSTASGSEADLVPEPATLLLALLALVAAPLRVRCR